MNSIRTGARGMKILSEQDAEAVERLWKHSPEVLDKLIRSVRYMRYHQRKLEDHRCSATGVLDVFLLECEELIRLVSSN
jgi:hypothetical protein